MNMGEYAKTNIIHKIISGSRLYGTARPDSDVDIRGVCLMPRQSLLGLTRFDQYQSQAGEDIVIYGLTKFFQLSLDNNPNILDILCAPRDVWLLEHPDWECIYDSRDLFLSQKLRYTFSGYAISQLKRIKGHRRWLLDPPDHRPEPGEYRGEVEHGPKGEQSLIFPNHNFQAQYNSAVKQWKDYQRWLNERNPKRAELERKYGYDTKHASHLVRLLLKAEEILLTGDYNPVLTGRAKDNVMDVLGGGWKYDVLVGWAENMDSNIRQMPTDLPKKPNRNAAERLLVEINARSLL